MTPTQNPLSELKRFGFSWEGTGANSHEVLGVEPAGDWVKFADVAALWAKHVGHRGPLGAIVEEAFSRPDSHVDGTEAPE